MDVLEEVRQIIAKALKIPVDTVTPEARLDDIGAQSLDVIEIVFELEEKFGISIPFRADDAGRAGGNAATLPFATIADVAKAVQQLVDAKAPS
jgi:acyl carrier protein